MNPRKLEHGFRMINVGIRYTLPSGHDDNDVPTFWLLLSSVYGVSGILGAGKGATLTV